MKRALAALLLAAEAFAFGLASGAFSRALRLRGHRALHSNLRLSLHKDWKAEPVGDQ